MKKRSSKHFSGFTLMELLVVVLIMGILAIVAVAQYQKAVEKALMTEAVMDVRAIANAHQMYYLANGEYLEHKDLEKLDIDIPGVQKSNKRVETKYFSYSPNGQGVPGTVGSYLALAWRVKGDASIYKIFVKQSDPAKIYCAWNDDSLPSNIQKELCRKLNTTGTL